MKNRLPAILDGPFYKGVSALGQNSVDLKITALCLLLICPALAVPASPAPEEPEQPAAAETTGGVLSTGTAAAGTAILVGTGAYTAVRKSGTSRKRSPSQRNLFTMRTTPGRAP